MKTLAILGLSMSLAAHADILNLYTTAGFGALHQYHNVNTNLCTMTPCEITATVTIYISTQASATYPPPQNMQLWFGNNVLNSYFGPYYGSGVPTTIMNATSQITVTINESSRKVCTHSGRGQNCHDVWTLLDGTLIQ